MRPTYDQTVIYNLLSHARPVSSGCIEWTGWRWPTGYGWIEILGRRYGVHRLVYELTYGPIPPDGPRPHGFCVCHTCDNRKCISPRHLFLGTHLENMKDMDRKGRRVGLRGEANPKARLTADKVRAIRDEYAAGRLSLRDLGRRYGVTKNAISRVVNREVWTHI